MPSPLPPPALASPAPHPPNVRPCPQAHSISTHPRSTGVSYMSCQAAAKEGCTPDEVNRRCQAFAQYFREKDGFEQRHREDLRRLIEESKSEGCFDYEIFRRIEARKRIHAAELNAFESHGPTCDRVFKQALKEGKNQQEAHARVQHCSHAHKEQWDKQRIAMIAEENIYRKVCGRLGRALG